MNSKTLFFVGPTSCAYLLPTPRYFVATNPHHRQTHELSRLWGAPRSAWNRQSLVTETHRFLAKPTGDWPDACFREGVCGGTQAVLKISITNQSSEATHFQLEGKLVGPWVEELRRLSDA